MEKVGVASCSNQCNIEWVYICIHVVVLIPKGVTVDLIKCYLPDYIKVYEDPVNQRWQAARPGRSFSRNWVMRGSKKQAAIDLLQGVWSDLAESRGEVCPVDDLFADE